MAHLILVKHAMPDVKPDEPPRTWQLSAAGRESCVPLADRLKVYDPQVIVSSDEPKAELTAQLVGARLSLLTQVVPELHEHDRSGEPFGTTAEFHSKIAAFFNAPKEQVYGTESAGAATSRFSAAIHSVVAHHPAQNIVVVAHGTVNTLFTAQYNETDHFDLWKRLGLPSFIVLNLPDYQLREIVEQV